MVLPSPHADAGLAHTDPGKDRTREQEDAVARPLIHALSAMTMIFALTVGSGGSPHSNAATGWTATRLSDPAGTEVRDGAGTLLARLTDGARTASISGPARQWIEAGLTATVTGDRWVRLLPRPFDGSFDATEAAWLEGALADRSPDLVTLAFQYTIGAPDQVLAGLRIAGDAKYGPAAGADFNDFLGVTWTYGKTLDKPEATEYGALDCSGFVRMLLGYRMGMPMSISAGVGTLPRRSADQFSSGPGLITVANRGTQVVSFGSLQPGDLLFFDASDRDGTAIDHVGIYLGVDSAGHRRFISSRQSADGPTMGDMAGASIIDGTGYWARAFRGVRRP
ncbi:MAG: NlpC/P60 family protein [Candidatus Limnocylindrales bacterium]